MHKKSKKHEKKTDGSKPIKKPSGNSKENPAVECLQPHRSCQVKREGESISSVQILNSPDKTDRIRSKDENRKSSNKKEKDVPKAEPVDLGVAENSLTQIENPPTKKDRMHKHKSNKHREENIRRTDCELNQPVVNEIALEKNKTKEKKHRKHKERPETTKEKVELPNLPEDSLKKISKPQKEKVSSNSMDITVASFRCRSYSPKNISKETEVALEKEQKRRRRRIKKQTSEKLNQLHTETEVLHLMDIRENFTESESINNIPECIDENNKKPKTEKDIKSYITSIQKKLDCFLHKSPKTVEKVPSVSKEPDKAKIQPIDEPEEINTTIVPKSSKPKVHKHRRKSHRIKETESNIKIKPDNSYIVTNPIQMYYCYTEEEKQLKVEQRKLSEGKKREKAAKPVTTEEPTRTQRKKKIRSTKPEPADIKERMPLNDMEINPETCLRCPEILHNLVNKESQTTARFHKVEKHKKKKTIESPLTDISWLLATIPKPPAKEPKENDIDEVKRKMGFSRDRNYIVEGVEPSLSPLARRRKKHRTSLDCRTVSVMVIPPNKNEHSSRQNDVTESGDVELIDKKMKTDLFKNYYKYCDEREHLIDSDQTDIVSDSNRIQVDLSDPVSNNSNDNVPSNSFIDLNKERRSKDISVCFKDTDRTVHVSPDTKLNNIVNELVDEMLLVNDNKQITMKQVSHLVIKTSKDDTKTYNVRYDFSSTDRQDADFMLDFKNPTFSEASESATENTTVPSIQDGVLSDAEYNYRYVSKPEESPPLVLPVDNKYDCPYEEQNIKSRPLSPRVKENSFNTDKATLRRKKSSNLQSDKQVKNSLDDTDIAKSTVVSRKLARSKSDIEIEIKRNSTEASKTLPVYSKSSVSIKTVIGNEDENLVSNKIVEETPKETIKKPVCKEVTKSRIPELKSSYRKKSSVERKNEGSPGNKAVKVKPVEDKKSTPRSIQFNRSKSELNPRQKAKEKDDSQINSLIELDKYHQRKPKRMENKNQSATSSLDRYFEKSASHMSSLFLTKQYNRSQVSSFQKRKSYDEGIRKKMLKKCPQKKSSMVPQQIFEVRFVTVMNNDLQKENNVILNKVLPVVSDKTNCNVLICCGNAMQKTENFICGCQNSTIANNLVRTEIDLNCWKNDAGNTDPIRASTELNLAKDKQPIQMTSVGTDPSPFFFRPSMINNRIIKKTSIPVKCPQMNNPPIVAATKPLGKKYSKAPPTENKVLQSVSVNTVPIKLEDTQAKPDKEVEKAAATTMTSNLKPLVNTSTSPVSVSLCDNTDEATQPSNSDTIASTYERENNEMITKLLKVISNKESSTECDHPFCEKLEDVKHVIDFLCQNYFPKSQGQSNGPPRKKRRIYDDSSDERTSNFSSITEQRLTEDYSQVCLNNFDEDKLAIPTNRKSSGLSELQNITNLQHPDIHVNLISNQLSCPILNSTTSSFDFLYEQSSSENSSESDNVRKLLKTIDTLPLKNENNVATNIFEKFRSQNSKNESSRSPISEESGYASGKSKKSSSVSNFFKKSSILALFKPSSNETIKKEDEKGITVANVSCEKQKYYNKMSKECQLYARKVVETKSSDAVVDYEEIPLEILLGRHSLEKIQEVRLQEFCSLHDSTAYCQAYKPTNGQVSQKSSRLKCRYHTKKKNIPKRRKDIASKAKKSNRRLSPILSNDTGEGSIKNSNVIEDSTTTTTTSTSDSSACTLCTKNEEKTDTGVDLPTYSNSSAHSIHTLMKSDFMSLTSTASNVETYSDNMDCNSSNSKEETEETNVVGLEVIKEVSQEKSTNEIERQKGEDVSQNTTTKECSAKFDQLEIRSHSSDNVYTGLKVDISYGSVIDDNVIEKFVSRTESSKEQFQRAKSLLTNQVYSGRFSKQDLSENLGLNTMRSQICNTFFENLFSIYEKEMEIKEVLYRNNNFFDEELEPLMSKIETEMTKPTRQKIVKNNKQRSVFGKFFKRKSKNAKSDDISIGTVESYLCLDSCNMSDREEKYKYTLTETLPNDTQDVKLMCEVNHVHVKSMAYDARRRFSSLVQAVAVNNDMDHDLKFCRFLKILECIEQGDFSVIRKNDHTLNEFVKEEIKFTFLYVYEVAFVEAQKNGKSLSKEDISLIKSFVIKYCYGLLFDTHIIATYIGRGLLTSEEQLKVAVKYVMSVDKNKTIDIDDFEKICQKKSIV